MNGVDRTKFNRAAAAPYKERKVIWHGQPGSFRMMPKETLFGRLIAVPILAQMV